MRNNYDIKYSELEIKSVVCFAGIDQAYATSYCRLYILDYQALLNSFTHRENVN